MIRNVEATEGGEQTSWGLMGAVSALAGYGAAPQSKIYVSKWTHGFFIIFNSMILYFKHIIHIDNFPLNGHPPSIVVGPSYCITPIFRVEEIFAIFANFDFARNFPPAKIISTPNGISRNFPPAKFSSREIFLHAKIKY